MSDELKEAWRTVLIAARSYSEAAEKLAEMVSPMGIKAVEEIEAAVAAVKRAEDWLRRSINTYNCLLAKT